MNGARVGAIEGLVVPLALAGLVGAVVVACGGPGGPPPPTTAERLNAEGLLRLDRGQPESADDLFRSALEEAELIDDLKSQAEAWNNRGALAFARGRCDEALADHGAALRIHGLRRAHDLGEMRTRVNLGVVLLACGRKAEAAAEIAEAEKLAKGLEKDEEARPDRLKTRLAAATLRLDEGHANEALAEADALAREADKLEDDALRAGVAALAGAALERSGKLAEARARVEEALAFDRKREAPVAVLSDLRSLARIAERQGDRGGAASYYLRASRIARRLGDFASAAESLRRAATWARQAGPPREADAIEAELRGVEEAVLRSKVVDGGV